MSHKYFHDGPAILGMVLGALVQLGMCTYAFGDNPVWLELINGVIVPLVAGIALIGNKAEDSNRFEKRNSFEKFMGYFALLGSVVYGCYLFTWTFVLRQNLLAFIIASLIVAFLIVLIVQAVIGRRKK